MERIEALTFPVAPLGCNCSILRDTATNETIVIDPGGEGPRIVSLLEEKGCKVKWIIHTHAHFDHCCATHEVATYVREDKKEAVKVAMHPGDFPLYDQLEAQCRFFGVPMVKPETKIDHSMEDEEEYVFGESRLKVLHTPGHTPGSCCFSVEEEGLLFSGDTLFARGIGRTDLPGGDTETIFKSIQNRLFTLDDGTSVIPGHGQFTRIYEERTSNPFFN